MITVADIIRGAGKAQKHVSKTRQKGRQALSLGHKLSQGPKLNDYFNLSKPQRKLKAKKDPNWGPMGYKVPWDLKLVELLQRPEFQNFLDISRKYKVDKTVPDYLRFSTEHGRGDPRGDFEYIPIPGFENRKIPKNFSPDYLEEEYDPIPMPIAETPKGVIRYNREGTPLFGWREDGTYGPMYEGIDPYMKLPWQSRQPRRRLL